MEHLRIESERERVGISMFFSGISRLVPSLGGTRLKKYLHSKVTVGTPLSPESLPPWRSTTNRRAHDLVRVDGTSYLVADNELLGYAEINDSEHELAASRFCAMLDVVSGKRTETGGTVRQKERKEAHEAQEGKQEERKSRRAWPSRGPTLCCCRWPGPCRGGT